MTDPDISERQRAIALKRWANATDEQRRRNTEAATAAKKARPPKTIADRVDAIGTELLAEIRELRAEVADLRQRVAA